MPSVDINDVTISYELRGEGPTLVYIHGMCGRGSLWDGQVSILQSEFTCLTYDRRGHGSSGDGSVTQSVPLHADDFAELVRRLDLAPVVLVGSSGGARIGVDVVLRYPDLLAGALLSEPPIFSLCPDEGALFFQQVVPRVQPMIESGDLRGAVDAFFSIVCPGLWSRLSDSEKEPYLSSGPMLVADLTQPPFEVSIDELHSVVLPLHAIAGADSAPFLHDTSVVIANAVPGATFEEFANCGHVTYVEQEAKFADATKAVARRSFED